MGIEVMTRVWKSAPYSGGTLLALLALADYADDYGICWPSQTDIAAKARLTERQLRRTLHSLEQDGELLVHVGKGRGNRTIYCILSGLPDADREEKRKRFPVIISGINFRLSPEKRKLAAQKAEISDTKKRTFAARSRGDLAQQDAPDPGPIRHGIRHVDPPPPTRDDSAGGGGGVSIEQEPTETERFLLAKKFDPSTAHEFRDLDLGAVELDYNESRNGGSGNGSMVKRWRVSPPAPPLRPGEPPAPPSFRRADDLDVAAAMRMALEQREKTK